MHTQVKPLCAINPRPRWFAYWPKGSLGQGTQVSSGSSAQSALPFLKAQLRSVVKDEARRKLLMPVRMEGANRRSAGQLV